MRYSRPARLVLGVLVLIALIWYEFMWFSGSVMGDEVGTSKSMYAPAVAGQQSVQQPAEEETQAAVIPDAEPTPTPTPEPTLSVTMQLAVQNAMAQGLPTPPDVDVNSWELLLANPSHSIAEYVPEQLAYLNMTADETDIQYSYNGYRCPVDSRIAEALLRFAQGCKAAGNPVYLSSGYRSYDDQNYLYWRKVDQGYSEDVAATIVARPGTSEHQTGLACDITDYYRELKDSSLENTDTYQWLKAHCAEYGFVVRYPADKSGSADSITGIIYEPWHFRYVGPEAARYMTDNNLCLEEFLALYGVA